MKKLISLVLALAMIMMVGAVYAESYGVTNSHTITVTSNGTGSHSYEAYQVFAGNLDAAENILTDITWGSGVDGAALLTALKANTAYSSAFAEATTAADVAKILGEHTAAAFVEAFAADVAAHLTTTTAGTGTSSGGTTNTASITVSGDGYYFVKDVTNAASLVDGDTYSKFMLNVVRDVAVTAKDTVFSPDKNILKANGEDFTKVKADSSAIGDTVTFAVDITIPDTRAYVDHFIMNMIDTLPAGLTFTGLSSVKVGTADVPTDKYTMTAKTGTGVFAAYTVPTDPITAAGGQKIKVVFNNFKSYVETNGLIGSTLTVTYTAVVNDDAVFGPTGNENEVEYIYSTDPNHDYDGDEPGNDDPTGETPKSKTKTVVTALQINKVNGSNAALAGAEFTITGTAYNTTLVTGEEFVEAADGTYWKLLDGSYTTQDPNGANMNTTQYASTTTKYKKQAVDKVVTVPTEEKIVGITNDAGVLNISGLKPGTYTIEETHAPDGYNKITETKTLIIAWDKDAGFSIGTGSAADFTMTDSGVLYQITIQNQSGTTLPSTGGIGTTIFYIVGGLLVIGAAVILVARRKSHE